MSSELPLKISIQYFNEVSPEDINKTNEGVKKFADLVQSNCGFAFPYTVTEHNEKTDSASFEFVSWFTKENIIGYGDYFFRYFQLSTFNLLNKPQHLKSNADVRFIITKQLTGHCGFAFPRIQFNDELTRKYNSNSNAANFVESVIADTIIIAAPSQNTAECSDSSRLVAHEMAHIFIQDENPHHCYNVDKKIFEICPDKNLLATYRKVYPSPRPTYPGNSNIDPGSGTSLNPDEPIIIKPWGTDIDEHQCHQIRKTIENL